MPSMTLLTCRTVQCDTQTNQLANQQVWLTLMWCTEDARHECQIH